MFDDLRILRGFVAVAEELNFRRAAERLHMSQPPLSRMISGLEEQLGAPLFLRNTRMVELTREGRLFLESAREVLETAAVAGREIRHRIGSQKRPLLIGCTSAAYFTGFPERMKEFRKAHPNLTVETVGMNSADQIEALATGRLDVGFILPPVLHEELSSAAFATVRMCLAVPEDHPSAIAGKAVPLGNFSNEIFILHERSKDPGMYEGILQCCSKAGFRPRIRVKIEDEPCMGLVTSGAGVHFSAATASCVKVAGVTFIELEGETPEIEVFMAWRKADPSEALAKFLTVAKA
jgi:LysR family transcriptional regulator, benzoate and cis,cis-muconate-responsive activator of ben and cat genes